MNLTPDLFSADFDGANDLESKYYIYRHVFSDGSFYVGKGSGGRYLEIYDRSLEYSNKLKEFGRPVISILENNLDEEAAYKIESNIIINARKNAENILNKTDGMEFGDIGSMPPKTLLRANLKSNDVPEKYRIFLNLELNISSGGGQWSIGASVWSTAIRMNCTCDEVLELMDNCVQKIKNDIRIVGIEEVLRVLPEMRNSPDVFKQTGQYYPLKGIKRFSLVDRNKRRQINSDDAGAETAEDHEIPSIDEIGDEYYSDEPPF